MLTISDKSRAILLYIAQGHSYQQIIETYVDFTYLDIFAAAQEAVDIIDANTQQKSDHIPYRIEDVRKQYRDAYKKWDDEQDKKLKELFMAGLDTNEIAAILKRQAGGITSRLNKLGLTR